ncbi:MAG: HNH endonuclease [Candidatus Odinarchaeota archaeon]
MAIQLRYYTKKDGTKKTYVYPSYYKKVEKIPSPYLRTSKSGKRYYSYYEKKVKPNAPYSKVNIRRCMERDEFMCRICGSKEHLQVHHLDNRGPHISPLANNDLTNLITLCASCHHKLHLGLFDKHHEIFERRQNGETYQSIATTFNVSRQRIEQIYKKIIASGY